MKTAIKAAIIAGVLFAVSGCRVVSSQTENVVNYNSGRDVIVRDSGQETVQEGTLAADKKVGDISPSTKVSAE